MDVAAQGYDIHLTLRDLINQKSERDQIEFTVNQLAKAIGMPHSILVKLLHKDPSKRVQNPRVDTLIRIVDFFKREGFVVSLDDFLTPSQQRVDIDRFEMIKPMLKRTFSLHASSTPAKQMGTVEIQTSTTSEHILAFRLENTINDFFKKGQIILVDTNMQAEADMLVAIDKDGELNIEKLLHAPKQQNQIVGVVVQVNT